MYYAGIDIGSSYTKAVIIDDDGKRLGAAVAKTGINFDEAAKTLFNEALKKAGLKKDQIAMVVSTGVGRNNCSFAQANKPEISCIAKGSYHLHGASCMVIDIGGQDNKVIKLAADGRQLFFKMNRKCAAGTGSFLEEIAMRLDTGTDKMNKLAAQAGKSVPINSFCTVFAGTEIIHQIRENQDINGIMRGIFESVVKRTLEMAPIDDTVVLSGGAVATNPVLIDLFKEKLEQEVMLLEHPQDVGALGAALYARSLQQGAPDEQK